MGFFDGKGANGYSGILGKILQNQYDETKSGSMAEALRRLGAAKTDPDRFGAMADYAQQGYDPNDLRNFNTAPKDDVAEVGGRLVNRKTGQVIYQPEFDRNQYLSAGNSIFDLKAGQPIYTAPQKPEKPDYSRFREVDGNLIDLATGKTMFTAPPKSKDHNIPQGYGGDVRGFVDSTRGVVRDKDGNFTGGAAPLSPDVENAIASRAAQIFQKTGNPEEAQQMAYQEIVGSKNLVESGEDTGIENDGSSPWYKPDKNYKYMKPEGFGSSVTRQGGGRTYREGQKAVNKQTGETMIYRNGQWAKQ